MKSGRLGLNWIEAKHPRQGDSPSSGAAFPYWLLLSTLLPHIGGGGAFLVADHIHVDDGFVEAAVSEPLHD